MRRALQLILMVAAAVAVPAHISAAESAVAPALGGQTATLRGIHKIRHVVIIMQENRSFDSYFGTYPGADGIPGLAGHPGNVPCIPDPSAHHCHKPWHNTRDINDGGPHMTVDAKADVNGGKMNGFIKSVLSGALDTDRLGCHVPITTGAELKQALAGPPCLDVMGYHTAHEIPDYWAYAHHYVLQDHMFEPALTWSQPAHLYMVSGWSAWCKDPLKPLTCRTDLVNPDVDGGKPYSNPAAALTGLLNISDNDETAKSADYGWTDITYLLHKHHVSWRYYLTQGTEPDCADGGMTCKPVPQHVETPEIWNPLPDFVDVHQDHQVGNIVAARRFFGDAYHGHLPAVSWVIPSGDNSEHAPARVSVGQDHVVRVVNAIMSGPDWKSTAIFLAWDDWGGFYDHVQPPRVQGQSYGLRVPGLVISPYARKGYVDHQTLSFDAYLKFIEDDFLGGQRLNPKTDGRPDSRPAVRENAHILGNLARDFDFNQKPRPPFLLPRIPPRQLPPDLIPVLTNH
jgi:phospholipase C